MVGDVAGILNGAQRGERADLDAVSGLHADALQFLNAADVHEVSGREELLLHGGQQVGTASDDVDVRSVLDQ